MHTFHTTLDADGSLVLPAVVLSALGLRPGDRLAVESDGDSLLVRRIGPEELPADPS